MKKVLTVRKEVEVEVCDRCESKEADFKYDLSILSALECGGIPIDTLSGFMCRECMDIFKRARLKRTRKSKANTE